MSDDTTDIFKRTVRDVVRAVAEEAKGLKLSEATIADLQSAARGAHSGALSHFGNGIVVRGTIPVMFIPQVTPIQPVNVVVQQALGMPEWVRILISAATGALFALGVSLMMEYLRPNIVKRDLKKEATEHLISELTENMDLVLSGCRY
jgi:hypothetical protein